MQSFLKETQALLYFPEVNHIQNKIHRLWSESHYEEADHLAGQYMVIAATIVTGWNRFVIVDFDTAFTGVHSILWNEFGHDVFLEYHGRYRSQFAEAVGELPAAMLKSCRVLTSLGQILDASFEDIDLTSEAGEELRDQPVNYLVDWSLTGYEWNLVQQFSGAHCTYT
jgi:hypothetical protein